LRNSVAEVKDKPNCIYNMLHVM